MKKRVLALGCLGILVLLLLGAGIGYVYTQYAAYRNSSGRTLESGFPQVTISIPIDGVVVQVGAPITISASAVGFDPFQSAELYLNGELVGVNAAPSPGLTPFNFIFTWIPTEPGVHQLIARAHDAAEDTAFSPGVLVVVLPVETEDGGEGAPADGVESEVGAATDGESGGESADATVGSASLTNVVFPQPPDGASQPPTPPGPNDSVGPSHPWTGTPGNWINSLNARSTPSTPQLVGASGSCGATLKIRDNSDNEEGFRIFRLILNAPGWSEVAQIASQSENDWLTFADDAVSGPVNYYVAAFNSQGRSDSNIVLVNIDSSDCPSTEDSPLLTVEIANLDLNQNTKQVYCYQSLSGLQWTRLPEIGFLEPSLEGLPLNDVVSNILLIGTEGQPLFETLELQLECWGWIGGELQFLGEFLHMIDPSNPSDAGIDLESISAEVLVDVGTLNDPGNRFPPIDAIPVNDPNLFLDPGVASGLELKYPEPETAQMPFIAAWPTYDPSVCAAHVEKESINFNHPLLTQVCEPHPNYNVGPGGQDPQLYIVWTTLDNTCAAGFNEACHSLEWWISYVEDRGGYIWWEVNGEKVPTIERTVWHGDVTCETSAKYYIVSLSYWIPDNLFVYGPKSNTVKVPCRFFRWVDLEVTLKTLHLSNLSDDDSDSSLPIEASGSFAVNFGGSEDSSYFERRLGQCREISEWKCRVNLINTSYEIAGLPLCENLKYWCYPFRYEFGNNSKVMRVSDSSTPWFSFTLTDLDPGYFFPTHDFICHIHEPIGWTVNRYRTVSEWASTSNESFQFSDSGPDGDCIVEIVIDAVTP